MNVGRILVFTRGESADDPAVSRAMAVARHVGADIVLLDVFTDLPAGWGPLLSSLDIGDAREEAERERRGDLARIVDVLKTHGIRAMADVRWGRPAIEILRDVADDRFGLVVLEDDRAHGLDGLSTAVIQHCAVPVWVVKNAPHAPPPRVLAAVDPTGPAPGALEKRILAAAALAADSMRGELFVVHAWQPLDEEFGWLPAGIRNAATRERVVKAMRERHEGAVYDLVASALPRLPRDHVRVIEGPAADSIMETIEEMGADVLVVGTARNADFAGMILGRTVRALAERVPISVVAVKPDGFVSPVSR